MRARSLSRPGRKGFLALVLLLMLILNDWLVVSQLQSTHLFAEWLDGFSSQSTLMLVIDKVLDAVDLILAAWYFPVGLLAITAVLWLLDVRRYVLLPLIVFAGWSMLIAVLSVFAVGV